MKSFKGQEKDFKLNAVLDKEQVELYVQWLMS